MFYYFSCFCCYHNFLFEWERERECMHYERVFIEFSLNFISFFTAVFLQQGYYTWDSFMICMNFCNKIYSIQNLWMLIKSLNKFHYNAFFALCPDSKKLKEERLLWFSLILILFRCTRVREFFFHFLSTSLRRRRRVLSVSLSTIRRYS